jgi:hypothetical protein
MTASAGPVLRKLHLTFGDRVEFLTVYVREAHPGDTIPQPKTSSWKLHHARMLKQRDKHRWTVAVDDVEGTFHRSMDAQPNAVYLIDSQGMVYFRALCGNDEASLRRALGALTTGQPAPAESGVCLPALLQAVGETDRVLRMAGPKASRDLRAASPSIWAVAMLAGRLRPLPALWRPVAAAALMALPVVAASAAAMKRLSSRKDDRAEIAP